jgi:hypothetical protein
VIFFAFTAGVMKISSHIIIDLVIGLKNGNSNGIVDGSNGLKSGVMAGSIYGIKSGGNGIIDGSTINEIPIKCRNELNIRLLLLDRKGLKIQDSIMKTISSLNRNNCNEISKQLSAIINQSNECNNEVVYYNLSFLDLFIELNEFVDVYCKATCLDSLILSENIIDIINEKSVCNDCIREVLNILDGKKVNDGLVQLYRIAKNGFKSLCG